MNSVLLESEALRSVSFARRPSSLPGSTGQMPASSAAAKDREAG